MCRTIASLLCDSNPKMKKEVLGFLRRFCEQFGQHIGSHMKPVVLGLREALSFKHGAVRAQAAAVSEWE